MSVDLEALKAEVEKLGEEIRNLKAASEVDKNAVGAAVKALTEAKKKYADNNNGVGVDGKPYEVPMSKAEKKAKEKAEKAAAAGQPQQQQVREEINRTKCVGINIVAIHFYNVTMSLALIFFSLCFLL